MTSAPPESAADFAELAARHYENFPVGSWLLPRAHRAALHRIYAFARIADDLADEARDARALAAFRAAFAAHLAGGRSDVPLFVDLAATIRERNLPEAHFFDLLDAFASDLEVHRHDEASLFAYCRRSANPVGRLVLRVCGLADAALDARSDAVCTGLQLLNHLQDLRSDFRERDRIYLPQADLARFGVREADLGADCATPQVRALVRHWLERTVGLLREGFPVTAAVPGRLRLELRAVLQAAARVVERIRAAGHDVLARRTRLTRAGHAAALVAALLTRRLPRALR
ncbi:MAG: squalene synthase HpnC [Planctomycetes bacterium]|nr:squalene synthase HpnC [Planctomycetota bacterium]